MVWRLIHSADRQYISWLSQTRGTTYLKLTGYFWGGKSRFTARSVQLAKELGITQKNAWFLQQRIRAACADHRNPITGEVKVAEYEYRQNTMGLNGILAIGRLLEQAVGKRLTYEGLIATPTA